MKTPGRIPPAVWLWAGLALTAYKLWLVHGQGIHALAGAVHDDRLFIQLAEHLVRGDWLGPYDELTLAKGPAYPLFIAAAFLLGLPLFFTQHLFYAGACALFAQSLKPAFTAAGARFAVFALLWCNPMTFDAPAMGRVLRQQIYGPLALLIVAALVGLYLRRRDPLRRQLPWAVLLGLAGGWFYLTREESLWLLPSVILLAAAYGVSAWRENLSTARRAGGMLLGAVGLALVPVLIVSALNYRHYGWFGTGEFRAPAFKSAASALMRVETGPRLDFVPVTSQTRAELARVSPAFAELQREFDAGVARGWAGASAFLTGQPETEEQIGGGWWLWALREAAARAGHHPDAAHALAFYQRLADEVNAAADAGALPAGPPRSGYLPRWSSHQSGAWWPTAREFAAFVVHLRHFSARPPPSTGSAGDLQLFRDLTRQRLSPPEGELDVVGAARYMLNLHKVERLQSIGKALRLPLAILGWLGGAYLLLRLLHAALTRRWSYPLTLALAAAGAVLASILLHAAIHVSSFPVKTISSFAPAYPLLLLAYVALLWDAFILGRDWRRQLSPQPWPQGIADPALGPDPGLTPRRKQGWLALVAAGALLPLLIGWGEFRQLFWFGDDLFLVDQIARMGFWGWCLQVFSENFVPLFKLLWGGVLLGAGGSYFSMILLLWLTHALNTALLGRLLHREGLPLAATALVVTLFALAPANLETLGWSVQWSAVLATTFLLLGLLAVPAVRAGSSSFPLARTSALLALCAAASACSFSRGVLTGPVLAFAVLAPVCYPLNRARLPGRLIAALAALLPALLVAGVIARYSSGNHQSVGDHAGAVFDFALSYYLLNPGHLLLGGTNLQPTVMLGLAAGKVALVLGALALSRDRVRQLLLVLLVFDLGSAVLVGVGRHHTGFIASLSSRYQYYALLATLPSLGLVGSVLLHTLIRAARVRRAVSGAMVVATGLACLVAWPATLKPFVDWRGREMRELMAAPPVTDPSVTVPALDFMHVERAKALQRAFHLH
jgi:hypothetical protein